MGKVAFATCVTLGLSCINAVYEIGGKFDLLITLKDEKARNKSGRVYLDEVSEQHDVPLVKIDNINDAEVIEALKKHEIDWLFIIGWSQIARKEILETPKNGCIGMHPTLLPKGRGRAAIPWAIIKGLDKTGVTLFRLDEGVDTGDIIGQGIIKIEERMNATVLYDKVNDMHIELIKRYWQDIVDNKAVLTKQNEDEATEWPGRKPEDGEIFNTMTVEEADRLIRAVTHPYPGAFYVDNGRKIVIWSADFSDTNGMIKIKDGFICPIEYEIEE
jgi:methionyl-tRNA formyltransferase